MRLARSLFFVPFVISQVVVGLIFALVLQRRLRPAQRAPGARAPPLRPLDSEHARSLAVIVAGLWPQTAYCMILYLAGLTTLRPDADRCGAHRRRARLDAAAGTSSCPSCGPVHLHRRRWSAIVSALRSFDLVIIMTSGGPYDSSTVLAYYMYEQTFLSLRYGYARGDRHRAVRADRAASSFFLWRLLRRERRVSMFPRRSRARRPAAAAPPTSSCCRSRCCSGCCRWSGVALTSVRPLEDSTAASSGAGRRGIGWRTTARCWRLGAWRSFILNSFLITIPVGGGRGRARQHGRASRSRSTASAATLLLLALFVAGNLVPFQMLMIPVRELMVDGSGSTIRAGR